MTEVEEFMYNNFPKCPVCKSDAEYDVSGLWDYYVQCRRCKVKWFLGNGKTKAMMLYKIPESILPPSYEREFPQLRRMQSIDFWKELDFEKIKRDLGIEKTMPVSVGARPKILYGIISNLGFEFPITESDFSPQHRKKITDLVSLLQKHEATLGKERAKAMEVAQARSIWNKILERKNWRDLESEREMLHREAEEIRADYKAKVEELAVSIKEYIISAAHPQIDFGRLLRVLNKKGIILETIECPNCSGILKISEVPKKEQVLECRYCGKSTIAINLFEKYKKTLGL